jgi:predicted small integral membrane protein
MTIFSIDFLFPNVEVIFLSIQSVYVFVDAEILFVVSSAVADEFCYIDGFSYYSYSVIATILGLMLF